VHALSKGTSWSPMRLHIWFSETPTLSVRDQLGSVKNLAYCFVSVK
jgi:hypothetical protein